MKCNRNGNTLVFSFDGLADVSFDTECNKALDNEAKLHGYEQKIRDTAAIPRKQKDGTVIVVTEAMRRENIAAEVARLQTSATWNSTERKSTLNPAILALAEKLGKTYAEAQAWIVAKATAELDEMQ